MKSIKLHFYCDECKKNIMYRVNFSYLEPNTAKIRAMQKHLRTAIHQKNFEKKMKKKGYDVNY